MLHSQEKGRNKNGVPPFESHAILKWYDILPEQAKEKAQKAQIWHIFLIC